MSRTISLIYGVLGYALFLGVSLYAFGFVGGFVTPTSLDGAPGRPLFEALAIDLGLLAAFALQHSGMARPTFKRWWTRLVPEPVERSTYVLLSSLAMVALFIGWQPIGGVVWKTEGPIRLAVIGAYAFGWVVLLYATFLIDHFDLFGLKQVWRRFTGRTHVAPRFHTPGLYRVVRHPIYIGWLMIFWAAPVMTAAHLVFAVVTTVYILVAIQFEERDLLDVFGAEYADYRRRTPMLTPRLTRRRRTPSSATFV